MRVKAKFSKETQEAILDRDWYWCIFDWCNNQVMDIHHIYFWLQSESDESRNDIDKGISLCRSHHDDIHGCKSWHGKREEAIIYLNNYYDR